MLKRTVVLALIAGGLATNGIAHASVEQHSCTGTLAIPPLSGLWVGESSCFIEIGVQGHAWEISYRSWGAIAEGGGSLAMDNSAVATLRNAVTGEVVYSIPTGGRNEVSEVEAWSLGGAGRQESAALPAGRYECAVEGRTAGQYGCVIWTE